jgi:hypothetical protein
MIRRLPVPDEEEVRSLLEELAGTRDPRALWPRITEIVARKEPKLLLQFALGIENEASRFSANPWVAESTLDEIERVLALTPGYANAEVLTKILRIPRGKLSNKDEYARIRFAASLLASAQDREVMLRTLGERTLDEVTDELFACWLQEAVVRGDELEAEPRARELWRRLKARNHPLSALPLMLDELELGLRGYVPRYELHTSRVAPPRRPSRPPRRPRLVHDRDGAPLTHEAILDLKELEAIRAAPRGWQESSNGRLEVQIFGFGRRCLETEITTDFLASLGVNCSQGQEGENGPGLSIIAVSRALNVLFAASANGGAYGGARRGAYGRLDAWSSVAGLAGMMLEAGFEKIIKTAEASSWLELDTASLPWFERVAWDLGLCVLRPDGHSLAILAATDTD